MAASLAGCPPAQAAAAACMSAPAEDLAEAAARWKAKAQASAAKYHAERQPLPPLDEPSDEPDASYILRGQDELHARRHAGDGVINATPDGLRPGSREFLAVLDELRDLHLRKTMDYGVDEDALANIRSSADVVNMPAWAGCILRISDKMHRLKSYFRRGKVEFDGLSDTLKDIACYAVIAEVLRREEQSTPPAAG